MQVPVGRPFPAPPLRNSVNAFRGGSLGVTSNYAVQCAGSKWLMPLSGSLKTENHDCFSGVRGSWTQGRSCSGSLILQRVRDYDELEYLSGTRV